MYLSFHPSKSDIKAHGILYSESLVFWFDNIQNVFSWSCYSAFVDYGSTHVHCKNMYDVQLSSQILFSGLHVRSFKSFGAAVEGFIIVGRIQYVCH